MTSTACLALTILLLATATTRAQDLFRERVAPVLEKRCLACHDATKKRGGLDLSTRKGLLTGSDNGPVVVPGQASKSKLIEMVSGPNPRMPRTGDKLTTVEVALLKRWVEAGAAWPDGVNLTARGAVVKEETWWSLRPLVRPAIPAVQQRGWPRTPIDSFVLATLEKRNLHPSLEADRRTLLRRVSFDLTGLPPTPEEIDAFVHDPRPDAYERIVERLLASPAYGERWGRHWLDVVHYGDTHGYDKDKRRDHAWPYRDWVISSLNADLSYRSFLRQQLAGDVLYPGRPEGVIATGFVVAGPWDFVGHVELREGTVDKEKTRVIDRDDMVVNALGTFNSLTVGCARCHDHKFDPIEMKDYYRLQAVFSGVERGPRPLSSKPSARRQQLLAEKKELATKRTALLREIDQLTGPRLAALERRLQEQRKELAGIALPEGAPSPTNGWHSAILPTPDHVRWVQVDLGAIVPLDEVRIFPARPTDFPDTPGFGFPARFKIEVSDEPTFSRPRVIADHTGEDFPNPGDNPYLVSLKGQKARYVRITATKLWKRTGDYVFALAEVQVDSAGKNIAAGKTVTSQDSIEAGRWSRRHLVDGFTSRNRLPNLAEADSARRFQDRLRLARSIRELEQQRAGERARLVPAKLAQHQKQLDARLADIDKELRTPDKGPMAYSVRPIPPRPIWVLKRGDVEQRREAVTPGTLSCIEGLPGDLAVKADDEGARRRALADWLADDRNVLTWRSIANRVWHYHFGKGIVDTPNDFGKMGGLPSHPELLDWLACEMRETHSLKHLHRLLVTSAVYRQASRHNEAAAKVDADNRLLWKMNRLRLDAESIRDTVLAVSGQLDRRMGGPGVELFRFKDDHSPIYDHSDLNRIHDPKTYRRTVYRFTVRSVPNPFLDSLDCADPNLPTPVRTTTLTALQALALLNNPFMVRQAIHFAEGLEKYSPKREQQIERAYQLAFGRSPDREELRAVIDYADKHGLAATCRVFLNANEFIFLD